MTGAAIVGTMSAVSYTHLDVYKRQLPYWSVTVIGNVLVPNVVSTVAEIVTAWSLSLIHI